MEANSFINQCIRIQHSQMESFIFWHFQMESSISLLTLGILKWNPFFVWHSQKESDSHTYTQIFFCLAFSDGILNLHDVLYRNLE